MQRVADKQPEDSQKVNTLCQLAELYPAYDPNKGVQLAQSTLTMAERLVWQPGIVRAFIAMGHNENSRADYRAAITDFRKALDNCTAPDTRPLRCLVLCDLGESFLNEDNYPDALRYFFTAFQAAEEVRNTRQVYRILEFIGQIYEEQKNYDKALQYYRMSYDTSLLTGEKNARAKNLANIGQVCILTGRYKEARDNFAQALDVFHELADESGIGISYAGLAMSYLELHQYADALANAHGAFQLYLRHTDRQNMASVYETLGKIYLRAATDPQRATLPDTLRNPTHDLAVAEAVLKQSAQLCKDVSYTEGLSITFSDLSEVYEQQGNFRQSLDYYRHYIALKDSIFSADNNVKIANLEVAREIALKDHQLQMEKLKTQKTRNENLFFLAGILFLLIITFALYRNFRTQQRLNTKISELVTQQEKVILQRTADLRDTNARLKKLIQFNAHQIREPITRILGLMGLRDSMPKEEFVDECLPMLHESVADLDQAVREVVKNTEETN